MVVVVRYVLVKKERSWRRNAKCGRNDGIRSIAKTMGIYDEEVLLS